MEGILVPITLFIVVGAVTLSAIYFRSRERQMMIERGLSTEQISEIFKSKKSSSSSLQIGIVMLFLGTGIGIGIITEEWYHSDAMLPFFVLSFLGLGSVAAFFAGRLVDKKDRKEESCTQNNEEKTE